jgi:hypothetical protein
LDVYQCWYIWIWIFINVDMIPFYFHEYVLDIYQCWYDSILFPRICFGFGYSSMLIRLQILFPRICFGCLSMLIYLDLDIHQCW